MSYSIPRGDELYHERLHFRLMDFIVALEALLALAFLGMFLYQVYIGPIGNDPAPEFFFLLMFLFMLGIVWLLASMRYLDISLTPEAITVAFGRFRKSVPWHSVASMERIRGSAWVYGYGLHLGLTRGGWVLVYNVINRPALSLDLVGGRIRRLVFSTAHPEEVLVIAERQMSGR